MLSFTRQCRDIIQVRWKTFTLLYHSLHGSADCCNGRSKKYRKWHFWGCSLSETLQWIDIKFDRDDYVGPYAKWHINRFRGVISAKG